MESESRPHQENGGEDSQPHLPVIVPNSVQGNVTPSTSDPLDGEVPAVVSITRVPAKPKQPEGPPVGGLKVRTDLGVPKPGPPPLLRVTGGTNTRPALPPMPRLKLGGQRTPGPPGQRFPGSNHHHHHHQVNGMMNMLNKAQLGQRSPSPGIINLPQPAIGSLSLRSAPVSLLSSFINNIFLFRQLRPKPAVPPASARPAPLRPAAPKQFSTFLPQGGAPSPSPSLASPPSPRPLQVRTVFVPPPMKMSGKSPSPASSASPAGPKVINSFNMSVPASLPLSQGISITPVTKGNSNGIGNLNSNFSFGLT